MILDAPPSAARTPPRGTALTDKSALPTTLEWDDIDKRKHLVKVADKTDPPASPEGE